MGSLRNPDRPPVFCPGCSHDRVVEGLDGALTALGLTAPRVAVVTDIGCSGLFDTFFRTHAFHGLHGRVLTYASGIKLAQPELSVVATMGDGGLGIGGAHLLAACRRNLDLTLLVLDNFNYGMTGGQASCTTPAGAVTGSGFLGLLEPPLDPCAVAAAAGAPYVDRVSAYQNDLADRLRAAVAYRGFSMVQIQGVCTGRYARLNRLAPRTIAEGIEALPRFDGPVTDNHRPEYGETYRATRPRQIPVEVAMTQSHEPTGEGRRGVWILGAAGQRVQTAADLLCLAGLSAGLHVSQKSEYDITVLRGPSNAEVLLNPDPIGYTGIDEPDLVIALAPEGVARRAKTLEGLGPTCRIVAMSDLVLPSTEACVVRLDPSGLGLARTDRALGALAWVAATGGAAIDLPMLHTAIHARFRVKALLAARRVIDQVASSTLQSSKP